MSDYILGVYEKFMPEHLTLEERLYAAKECGYDFLEISIDESDKRLSRLKWTAAERTQLKNAINTSGTPIKTMCLSAHRKYPLGSSDAKTRERSLEIMKRALELATDLDLSIIQLAGYDVYYEPSTELSVARFEEGLRACVEMAEKTDIVLGFETMETDFMNTVEKAMRYVSLISSPALQVYPDIGNLTNGSDDVPNDLRKGEGHIFAAHLKETKQGVFRDMFPGEGRVDFNTLIPQLYSQGVRIFNAECWYREGDDYAARMRSVCEFYRSIFESRCTLEKTAIK